MQEAAFSVSKRHLRAWAAAVHFMIEPKDNPVRSGGTSSSQRDLEEVRLRQQAIGVKLRHMFDEVVNEPVPTEFLDILRQADERSGGGA